MFIYKSLLCGKIPPKKKKEKTPLQTTITFSILHTPWRLVTKPQGCTCHTFGIPDLCCKINSSGNQDPSFINIYFLFPVKKEVYIICIR